MTLIHRLFMPSPIAWNTDEKTMSTPARAKLREMMRSAYWPMTCIVSDALNIFIRSPGASWKITMPMSMMDTDMMQAIFTV